MNNTVIIGLIAFAAILAGAFAGVKVREGLIGQGTPKAFVALLVFSLALLFASFGLFAPPNLTSAVTLTLCALAVAGAVAMFLELERGFGGLVHISPEPMRQAVKTLEAEPSNQNAP